MNIIYSDEELPNTYDYFGKDFNGNDVIVLNEAYQFGVMLCGPTPRDDKTESWRKQAIKYFEKYNFEGTIFIPERKDWSVKFEYLDQVKWELQALNNVKNIMFWIPRDLKTMPAYTTNVEFGYHIRTAGINLYYGRPDDAPKNRYLDFLYEKYRGSRKIYNDLETMIKEIIKEK